MLLAELGFIAQPEHACHAHRPSTTDPTWRSSQHLKIRSALIWTEGIGHMVPITRNEINFPSSLSLSLSLNNYTSIYDVQNTPKAAPCMHTCMAWHGMAWQQIFNRFAEEGIVKNFTVSSILKARTIHSWHTQTHTHTHTCVCLLLNLTLGQPL